MRLRYASLFFLMFSMLLRAEISLELGGFTPRFDGEIENPSSVSVYDKDLQYKGTLISYFGAEADFDAWYLPTLRASYFNMSDSKNALFPKGKTFVERDYNGSITTWTDYQVFNAVIAKDFYQQGRTIDIFGRNLYTGDLIFDLGLNLKTIDYRFEVRQNGSTAENDFISVQSSIYMPYFALSYKAGYVTIFGEASGLALGEIKANSFKGALEYRFARHIALRGGYMYEDFEATEKKDKITFKAAGAFGTIRFYF